jgi:hypothetical protein
MDVIELYGIVTTCWEWLFIKWSGSPPSIKISKLVACSFDDVEGPKQIVTIISGILYSQANT